MKIKIVVLNIAVFSVLSVLMAGVALAERMAVSVPKANVRLGPGEKYDIIWNIEKYHPLEIVKKTKKWYRFRDFEGDEGWIFKNLLDKTDTVITFKKKCNVRSGPGTKFKIAFTVAKGIPFKVLQRKGDWIQISHADGDQGWIFKSLVW
ncbi:SH3 domain-containing protein [Desulfococcaceae bacterium HSG9]|nr:SH3 domain-containing protein [Desulfococcaceae bacterium HSG9]